ncbi:MAG: DUF1616 domain-containing protein [Candidatus Bathyarchaeia archaeon]
MSIGKYGVTFLIVVVILALLVASPALSKALVYPRTDFFSEMWLLGSNHTAEDYPFNLSSGQSYDIYLGLGDQLGYCAYYQVEVKFRNESQSMPSSLGPVEDRVPSDLPSLYNVSAFVADQGSWELPVSFGFNYVYDANASAVRFESLTFNGNLLSLAGESTVWNSTMSRFYGDLVFELWLYNSSSSSFVYHDRFVDLKLNMTVT